MEEEPKDLQEEAEKILSHLSLKQKIGYLLIIGFQGVSKEDKSVIEIGDALKKGYVGGVVFYSRNILSPSQCTSLNSYFYKKSPDLPPFLCIDQEGGKVLRLTLQKGFTKFKEAHNDLSLKDAEGFLSPYEIVQELTPELAYKYYLYLAKELKDAGFNFNFGPILDINVNPSNPAIGLLERSFSRDPQITTNYAESFIKAHSDLGILTAAKHFPGHGSTTIDSHKDLPDITSTYNQKIELAPYRHLLSRGLLINVMTGHLFHNKLDPNLPTSLSPRVIKTLLRKSIGFQGLCLTDALDMGALYNRFSLKEIVISALKAGNEILIFSNSPKAQMINQYEDENFKPIKPEDVIHIVQNALKDGSLLEQEINRATLKVIKTKLLLKHSQHKLP